MVTILKENIVWATQRHKSLKYAEKTNILSGELRLDFSQYKNRKVGICSFNVEIDFNKSPENSMLPVVKSTGNEPESILKKIKKQDLSELHIGKENREICLCMPERESDHFIDGKFDIKIFFKEILEYYIYWINYYTNTKHKLPDYSHGILGYFELFAENRITFEKFCEKIQEEHQSNKIYYIAKCIEKNKPINFKKHKLRIHNRCLCEHDKHTSFRYCTLIHSAIYKINVGIKKKKRLSRLISF